MSYQKHLAHRRLSLLLATSCCAATVVLPALAVDPGDLPALPVPADFPAPSACLAETSPNAPSNLPLTEAATTPGSTTPSQNVTINLINRLVQRGVLSKEDAADLINQAEQDAATAQAQAAALQTAVVQVATAQASTAQTATPIPDDTVRVTYIPETVKAQMRDEIKQSVMAQARDENWAAPRTFPTWVERFKLFGDVRVRYQGDFLPVGNAADGSFPNFNAINTGAGLDVNPLNAQNTNIPYYNVDQDRSRFRLRARLGAEVDLGEGFSSGIRIATGDSNSPVTQNQTLGGASSFTQGQGGDFSKYSIWLDRGFIKYELSGQPTENLAITVGRFDNPFFNTNMIWSNDIGFDGGVIQGKYEVSEGIVPFLTMGAFPVFNTDFNFATNNATKFPSNDKWLNAIQGGADVKINKDFSTKLAAAFFDFENIEGKLSDPTYGTSSVPGNTDASRPFFAQRGNTYMAIRDIVSLPNASDTTPQYQYFGLATPFREFVLTGRLDYSHLDPFHIALTVEVVKNLSFDRNAINAVAINNRAEDSPSGKLGRFAGGDTGWITNFMVGHVALENRWDWNMNIGYRYVESDAVVDGFCDSDFGGGGTNLKGFTVSGALGVSSRVWLGLRWFSAASIVGPPYKNDILQFDINAKF